ncbi:MAG: hypothetical protein AAF393_15460 [Pseudomonadota bacterium]
MTVTSLKRPLAGYLIVQTALVLVVLGVAHGTRQSLVAWVGLDIPLPLVSIGLVLSTQLPVAILFARYEARALTRSEAWVLGLTFVGFTVAAEGGLQFMLGQWWVTLAARNGLLGTDANNALVFGTCITLMAVLLVSFCVGALFQLAVRNNLNRQRSRVFYRPAPRLPLQIATRGLCILSAGLAGMGVACLSLTGWSTAHILSVAVLFSGAVYTGLPRQQPGGAISWSRLWIEVQPIIMAGLFAWGGTRAMGFAATAAGSDLPAWMLWFGPQISAVVLADISQLVLAAATTNVVVIWLFAALFRPLLLRGMRASRPDSRRPRRPNRAATLSEHDPMARDVAVGLLQNGRDLVAIHSEGPVSRRPVYTCAPGTTA